MTMPLSFEEVASILDEIVDSLPNELYEHLNGGIYLMPDTKHNAKIPSNRYYVLGEYHNSHTLGKIIFIYYGSFIAVHGTATREQARQLLTQTVKHELRHHMEGLAGCRDLEVEDEEFVKSALRRIRGSLAGHK